MINLKTGWVTILLFLLLTSDLFAHGTKDKTMISPAELSGALENYQILDLRTNKDYLASHVPGAYLVPLKELSEQKLQNLGILPPNRLVLYSTSESQANKGKLLLGILGYEEIRILAGGVTHWLEDGQDVETGPGDHIVGGTSQEEIGSALEITPESHDLGVILKEDGVVNVLFEVNNTSQKEVSLENITTSCGCTTAEVNTNVILPGEAIRLNVYFDPNFHKEPEGKFTRTVFLETSENKEIQARIQVEIQE